MQSQTVLAMERSLMIFSYPELRLHNTYNRKFLEEIKIALIIEQYLLQKSQSSNSNNLTTLPNNLYPFTYLYIPQVRDGHSPYSPRIGHYCGTTAPSPITSSSSFLWVKFFSDATTNQPGFVATLQNVDPICGSHIPLNVTETVQVTSYVSN